MVFVQCTRLVGWNVIYVLCLGSSPEKKTSPETKQSVLGPTEQELVAFPLQE